MTEHWRTLIGDCVFATFGTAHPVRRTSWREGNCAIFENCFCQFSHLLWSLTKSDHFPAEDEGPEEEEPPRNKFQVWRYLQHFVQNFALGEANMAHGTNGTHLFRASCVGLAGPEESTQCNCSQI